MSRRNNLPTDKQPGEGAEVKLGRWQLIAERVRDAFFASSIKNRVLIVYQVRQMLRDEEMNKLSITKEDIDYLEKDYVEFKMNEIEITSRGSAKPTAVVCKDGSHYDGLSGAAGIIESQHNRALHRLAAERTLGKIIRAIVEHAETLGIKVYGVNVQMQGPDKGPFGKTRIVGSGVRDERSEEDQRDEEIEKDEGEEDENA